MLDLIGIWEIWRPGWCLTWLVTFWGPLPWGIYLVCNGVLGWLCVSSGIRMNAGTQSYPAEHGWSLYIFLLPPDLYTLQPRFGWISKCKWVNRLIVRPNLYVVFLLSLVSMNHLWSIYTTEIRATRVINFHCGLIYRHLKIAIDHWLFQMCVDLDEMLISLSCYCKNSNEGALLQG